MFDRYKLDYLVRQLKGEPNCEGYWSNTLPGAPDPCEYKPTVQVNGKWYCEAHDPNKPEPRYEYWPIGDET